MPLTARCHSLRPERQSGWFAFFELVPRGGRAAHFLVVGPADNLDREAREAALRGAQAAVRYLKEVPGQAPASTLIASVLRILTHETEESGAAIEFGCAVLEDDRLWYATRGRTGLVPLSPEPGAPLTGDDPNSLAVKPSDRFFLGRPPQSPDAQRVSRDFIARLEHGGGGDGGLVVTLTFTGTGAQLDLAPPEDSPETPSTVASADADAARPPRERPAETPSAGEPPAGDPDPPPDASSGTRHQWKTVELPHRTEARPSSGPGEKQKPLPMWESVDLPEKSRPDPDLSPASPAEERPPATDPADALESPEAEPGLESELSEEAPHEPPEDVAADEKGIAGTGSGEPFAHLMDELRDVFDDEGQEPVATEEKTPIAPPDGEEAVAPPYPDWEIAAPPSAEPEDLDTEEEPEAPEPPRPAVPEPLEPLEVAASEREDAEPAEERVPWSSREESEESPPEPAPDERGLYAPEETRGLGFWLAVVAAIIALGAVVVYLTVLRPRLAAPPDPDTAANTPPAEADEPVDSLDPSSTRVAWTQTFEDAVTSSPLVVGNMVVFGCRDGRVYALDRATGRRRWAYAASEGFGSSPVLAGDLIVIGGYDGHLYALDAATGEERWAYDTGGRVVGTPAVDAEYAYVGSYSRTLYALSLADGSVRWRQDLGAVLWASPAMGDDVVVVAGLDGRVTALDRATGRRRWQAATGGAVYSSPLIAERKVILGSQDGSLHAFDLASGEPSWSIEAGSPVDGSPAYYEGRVVVGTNDGTVLGVDVGLGRIVWRLATGGEVKSRPAFRDRLVWLTGYDGYLHGIEWLTGAAAARFPIDSSAYSSPAIGDGTAYFGTMDGRFLAVQLGGPAP